MKYNWFNVRYEERKKWEDICQPGYYRIISGSEIQSILDSVLIAGSATSDGKVYYMANGNRIDASASAIDQMPFGLVFIGNSASGSACLIQHGNWENRSIKQPIKFWDHISGSDVANYFPLSELPEKSSGKLEDLQTKSQNAAFEKIIDGLKDNSGE